MTEVSLEHRLQATADSIWATISDFGGIRSFLDAVTDCVTNGADVGSTRTLTLEGGIEVVERLEELDGANRRISYSIQESPLPVQDYVSTMQVIDDPTGGCQLRWSSRFDVMGVPEEDARGIIEGIYRMGFEGLDRLHGDP